MRITFDNRKSSSDSLEEIGKKILQKILEKGIYEDIQLDVIHDDSGDVWRHEIVCESITNVKDNVLQID